MENEDSADDRNRKDSQQDHYGSISKQTKIGVLFENDRLILLFTYETDLGDGWEDQEVHNDPEYMRLKALQMGANIIKYVFNN